MTLASTPNAFIIKTGLGCIGVLINFFGGS